MTEILEPEIKAPKNNVCSMPVDEIVHNMLLRIESLEERVTHLTQLQYRDQQRLPQEVLELHTLHGLSLIASWRRHLGLTQKDLAERLNIAQPTVAKFETASSVKLSTIRRIAKAMGIRYELLC